MSTSLPLARLVEDFSIYPRHEVDGQHVLDLELALRAGAVLPPIVAEESSKRYVDGIHRGRAYGRVFGPGAVVQVELVRYASEAELLADAMHRNSAHGKPLMRMDQVRCTVLGEKAGLDDAALGRALGLPVERAHRHASMPRARSRVEQPARAVNRGRAAADISYGAARLEAQWKADMNNTRWLLVAALLVVPVVACLDTYAWLSVTTTSGPAWLLALLVGLLALAMTLSLTVLVWLTKLCIRVAR